MNNSQRGEGLHSLADASHSFALQVGPKQERRPMRIDRRFGTRLSDRWSSRIRRCSCCCSWFRTLQRCHRFGRRSPRGNAPLRHLLRRSRGLIIAIAWEGVTTCHPWKAHHYDCQQGSNLNLHQITPHPCHESFNHRCAPCELFCPDSLEFAEPQSALVDLHSHLVWIAEPPRDTQNVASHVLR